jgi:hypothetical protein
VKEVDVMKNPFSIGKEFRKESFIDREEETKEALKIIESSNNLVLYAPRRFGKTWFAKNMELSLKEMNVKSIWIDFFSTVTVKQFISRFNEEISSIFEMNIVEYLKKFLSEHVGNFSLNIGGATLELRTNSDEEVWEILYKTLSSFDSKLNDKLVIFMDEAQEMTRLGRKFEKILRTAIQHQRNTSYVFLGSRKSLLEKLFFEREHPLFNSALKFDLSKNLPESETVEFLKDAFKSSGKKITDEAIHSIVEYSKLHPFYLQIISFEVWNSGNSIDETDVERCVANLVERNGYFYRTLIENLNSKYTLTILKMISNEEFSYSARELIKWEIKSPASISKVVENLKEREIILEIDGKYTIADPIFERFIQTI